MTSKGGIRLSLDLFDPARQLLPNKNIMIIGSAKSGKSHLLKDLMSYISLPFAVLVNPTEFATGFFGDVLPKPCKLELLTDSVLEKLCNRQRYLCEFLREHPEYNIDPDACIIMDKCEPDFIDLKWDKNPNFKFLFRSGKEARISMIFTANHPLKMPAHYLPSIDYVFILRETNPKHRRALWNMFGGRFKNFKHFDEVLDRITSDDYYAMVIDMTKISGKLDEHISFYKAPKDIPKFYLGCENLYRLYAGDSSIEFHDMIQEPLELFKRVR